MTSIQPQTTDIHPPALNGNTRRTALAILGLAALPAAAPVNAAPVHQGPAMSPPNHVPPQLVFAPDPVVLQAWRAMVEACPMARAGAPETPDRGEAGDRLAAYEQALIQRPATSAADLALKALVVARHHEVFKHNAFWSSRVLAEQAAEFLTGARLEAQS